VHPGVLGERTARTGILLVLVFNAGVPSFTYLLLLYLQTGLGLTPLEAALVCVPFPVSAVLGSRGSARLAHRWGPRLLVSVAVVLAGVTAGLTPALGSAQPRWPALVLLAIGGAAFGVFTASVFSLVLARVAPEAVGSASGLLPTAQQLGGSVGVTLAGLAYFAPADGPTASFGHAMVYETAVFLLTAAIGTRLTHHRRSVRVRPTLPPAAESDPVRCGADLRCER
jgi:predicted MFS family arabinose efflux permease